MEIVCKRFDELTNGELYSILKARSEVFALEQNIPYQDMDDLDFCSSHIFATEGDTLCSYLRIIDAGVKYPEISIGRLLTLPQFRGRGLSRRLMKIAIEMAANLGIPVRIEAQAYLKDFYLSLGFRQISDEFILEGLPHVEMILDESSAIEALP